MIWGYPHCMKPPSLNVPSSLMKAFRLWDYRPSAKTRLQLLDAFLDDVNGLQALHRASSSIQATFEETRKVRQIMTNIYHYLSTNIY